MPKIKNLASSEIIEVSEAPVWIGGVWECGDRRFTDETGDQYQVVLDSATLLPPTLGAIAFMRMFTPDERVKARQLRATDLQLDDFWRQLEDPRTDVVVMALPSIQADIEYTLEAVKAAGVNLDVAARKATILSGEIS